MDPTAALAVEILCPDDKTWDKPLFYAAHHIDELLIIDPAERHVHWLTLTSGEYHPSELSRVIDTGPRSLTSQLGWA